MGLIPKGLGRDAEIKPERAPPWILTSPVMPLSPLFGQPGWHWMARWPGICHGLVGHGRGWVSSQ